MKRIYFLPALLMIILLFSCSGNDSPEKDKIPPAAPNLLEHLGDTGDDPITIDDVEVILNDDNNGIDTVPDGNWIKIPWKRFIDNDLSHLKVYRFTEQNPEPQLIDTVPAAEDYYLDQSYLVEREWYYYYIELYDASGNFSVSDTVSYAILAKSSLSFPAEGASVSPNNLKLYWTIGDSQTTEFRVLIWDEQTGELVYHINYSYTPNVENPPPPQVPFPIMTPAPVNGQVFRWRVDAFDYDAEHNLSMGSESEERTFVIQYN
ncbi:MAG: hypothetical protein ABFC98_02765 [Candidatus Cloacimonas sp.]